MHLETELLDLVVAIQLINAAEIGVFLLADGLNHLLETLALQINVKLKLILK